MLSLPRPGLALSLIAAAAALGGCLTHVSKPPPSQAVLDARAHRDVVAAAACPQAALATASPVQLGFAYGEATLDVMSEPQLTLAARWLACHTTPAVIKPDADGFGATAEQDQLARKRADVVSTYLTTHGVAASRIRVLARGQAAPAGEAFLIQAEGRRW